MVPFSILILSIRLKFNFCHGWKFNIKILLHIPNHSENDSSVVRTFPDRPRTSHNNSGYFLWMACLKTFFVPQNSFPFEISWFKVESHRIKRHNLLVHGKEGNQWKSMEINQNQWKSRILPVQIHRVTMRLCLLIRWLSTLNQDISKGNEFRDFF